MRSTSTTALALPTVVAPRRLIDDARELDDEMLLAILQSADNRALVVGVVTGVASGLATGMITALNPIAAFAMIPAFVAGFAAASVATRRTHAAQIGVTPGCYAAVQSAFRRAQLRRDLRKMQAREWLRSDYVALVALTRAELER